MIWEEDLRDRVPFSFQHIKGAVPVAFTLDVDLDHLTEVAFVKLTSCKVFFFFFLYFNNVYLEGGMHSPHLRSEDLWSLTLRLEYLHKSFGILLHGRYLFSHLFIHLFINMDSQIFILYL